MILVAEREMCVYGRTRCEEIANSFRPHYAAYRYVWLMMPLQVRSASVAVPAVIASPSPQLLM